MDKKLSFLFFGVLVFLMPIEVSATPYFLGVEIDSASAPAYDSTMLDTNYCLPVNSTMEIKHGTISNPGVKVDPILYTGTVNPVTLAVPACAGSTIWSGLLNIENGNSYVIEIAPNSYCPGYLNNGYCWVAYASNKDCIETCGHYNLVPRLCYAPYQDKCSAPIVSCEVMRSLAAALRNSETFQYPGSCSAGVGFVYSSYSSSAGTSYINISSADKCSDCLWKNTDPKVDILRACTCMYPFGTPPVLKFDYTAPL
jgi:hypothetical protein